MTDINRQFNTDCRNYTGYKPCGNSETCENCARYDERGKRIIIIKLGAMGDVLRTTPILKALKEKYPPCEITWITDPNAIPLLKNNPLIDKLLPYDTSSIMILLSINYNLLLNFEKEQRALALAKNIHADEKLGFASSEYGTLTIYNKESKYALMLGLDDDLKFHKNQKTYIEIIFEMAKLEYKGEEYQMAVSERSKEICADFINQHGLDKFKHVIGIHTGCGKVFATKAWNEDCFVRTIESLNRISGIKCVLLGGPLEKEQNERIAKRIGVNLINSGTENSIEDFIGIMNSCELVLSLDSLAMHIAIALKKKVVVLFGATCSQEIELFGRGEKVVSNFSCSPCYKQSCTITPNCMDSLKPDIIVQAIKKQLNIQ